MGGSPCSSLFTALYMVTAAVVLVPPSMGFFEMA
jgi:hypothetical protein